MDKYVGVSSKTDKGTKDFVIEFEYEISEM